MRNNPERLPAGWTTAELGSAATITLGGTPSTEVTRFWGGDIPWMSSGEVHKRHIEAVDGRITDAGLASSNATLVDPPSVAVALAGQGKTRGTAALVRIRLCTNQSVALIQGRNESLDASFLFYELDRRYEELRARSSGGGRAGLSRRVLAHVPLQIPPIVEQRRIAEILDSVDEAILGTEQLIAKLKQTKHGLLRDMLTRGVDENGELRDPQRHTEEFRESAIGQVPREWEVTTLAEAGMWMSGGTPSKAVTAFWNGSMPWVSPKDMKSLWLDRTIDSVSRQAVASGTRVAPAGSVMIVVRGMILAHSFPVSVIQRPMAFNQDVKAIVATAVDSRFLAFWLVANAGLLLGLVTESTHGTKRIELRDLLQQPMPRPPSDEQARILSVLLGQESRIEEESATLAKLQLVRQGLMDDLLTGRVRVNKIVEGVVV